MISLLSLIKIDLPTLLHKGDLFLSLIKESSLFLSEKMISHLFVIFNIPFMKQTSPLS